MSSKYRQTKGIKINVIMNSLGKLFNVSKSVSSYVKQQNILGYIGINSSYINKNAEISKTTHFKYPTASFMSSPNNLSALIISEIGQSFPQFTVQKSPFSNILMTQSIQTYYTLTNRLQKDEIFASRYESMKTPDTEPVLSRKDKLKRAVKEYGSTVIIFHVGISLISLGTCYILVSSGIDMGKLLIPLGVSGSAATNAGTFVTAYAIHKVFAPVRISITLGATPFIVRYLRQIGFLKKPKVQ